MEECYCCFGFSSVCLTTYVKMQIIMSFCIYLISKVCKIKNKKKHQY